MTLRIENVSFDCDDALAVAGFWSAALGRPLAEGASSDFASLSGTGDAPTLFFTKVPEAKGPKNRVHVDLHADDREAEVERLMKLGATRLADVDEWGHRWTVLADIEGNEFCVAG